MNKVPHTLNFIFIFLVYITIVFLPNPTRGNAEVRVLMDIKMSLDPYNKLLKSWRKEGDPCDVDSFEGVACNQHHKVANISLPGKGLNGRLSPAVAGLRCLSGLYLHFNSLYGEIPNEISNLTELVDLYLNMNNFSGNIPTQIGNMASLQVLELAYNQLEGSIPSEIGHLDKLSFVTLQHNRLSGSIPSTIGNLMMLKWLYLSFNNLSGNIPMNLANSPQLKFLDLRNNSFSGVVSPAFKKLKGAFKYENNHGLCGVGFSMLRVCTSWDNTKSDQPYKPLAQPIPIGGTTSPRDARCNRMHCPKSSKLPQIAIVAGVTTASTTLLVVGLVCVYQYHTRKQKIGITSDGGGSPDDRISTNDTKDSQSRSASPLVTLEYSNKWDPMFSYQIGSEDSDEFLQTFKFNLEEVESATHYFSEVNLLGKGKFSAVYKGVLKDGSVVAIKCINVISCKSEEVEFMNGLRLLTSLRHENLARLRGFCCSMGRGECYLIYSFATRGNLSQYIDLGNESSHVLDWKTRVFIITGIAKGIEYIHENETNRPAIVHQNISVEKVVLDQQFNPIIMDSGLVKILGDDIVFSTLKVSAALGYMAPEYITTGRFTAKSDVYAFGVIILQILSGKTNLTYSMRQAAESRRYHDFVDANMNANFSTSELAKLTNIALTCTDELPQCRPTMKAVIQELGNLVDIQD